MAEAHLRLLSASFPVVLVTGARQVGKSTLVRHVGALSEPERRYVSLDEYGPRTLAETDPELFLQRFPAPVTIDEIQHVPALLSHLKPLADRLGPGAYWLTGSQQFPMMRGVSESLAGRVGIVELTGMSRAEERGLPWSDLPFRPDRERSDDREHASMIQIFERIVRGGMPRLLHPDAPPRESFFGAYLQTYVERDVRSMMNVSDLATFRRFIRVLAARVGQLVNLSAMAREVGIAVSTARSWVDLLEATHQVVVLRPFYRNLGKRQIKTPKVYLADTGLLCHLLGWHSAETAASGAMAGPLLENHVLCEVRASYSHRGRSAPIWFWRSKEGREVDLLIEEEGLLHPVEVKLTASPSSRDLGGFRALVRTGAAMGHGAVVCMARRRVPIDRTADAVPVDAIE